MDMSKIKDHLKKYKMVYISVGCSLAVAGITVLIMRDVRSSQLISRGISVTAEGGISVLGKKVEMNNVSYISSNRQGPPSWVVRCLETDKIFTSQSAAAKGMNLSTKEISKHLNGVMSDVRGFHFERICMAA